VIELIPVLVVAAGGVAFVALRNQWRRSLAQGWREAAESCGLTKIEETESFLSGRRLTGWSETLHVEIAEFRRGKNDTGTRVSVVGPTSWGDLAVRRETLSTALEKQFVTRESDTGDAAFDDAFFVRGTPAVVHALLGHDVRRRMRDVSAPSRLYITGNTIGAEMRNWHVGGHLAAVLKALLEVCRELGRRSDNIVPALSANAQQDPDAPVRLKNLLVLMRDFRDHPETEKALEAACADVHLETRLRAAIARGRAGHAALRSLIDGGPVRASEAAVAEAIQALGPELGIERTKEELQRALSIRSKAIARACVQVLGAIGTAEAERQLLGALGHESLELRVAAAEALGRAGSVAAVLSLREAAAKPPRDRQLDRAARQAIAEIQARLTGASQGQVSLTSADTGQVSLAATEGGGVSLPDADAKP
jgi:hypothetical protein